MSSTPGHKPKSDSYAYSWFLPAPGNNGSANASRVLISESEAAGPQNAELEAQEARTEQWRHSAEKSQSSRPGSLSLDQSMIRLAGVIGWSAVAGTGALVLFTRGGEFPSTQLGILAGVWLGVSAAIWFVPGILSHKNGAKE